MRLKELSGDMQETRVAGIPITKNIQMIGGVVNSRTEEKHVRSAPLGGYELRTAAALRFVFCVNFGERNP